MSDLPTPGPPAGDGILLEARGVCKYFTDPRGTVVRALDQVSLTIVRGGFHVLMGPSGSGKTTLLTLLGALDRPTAGQILFQGRDLGRCADTELTRLRRRTGFIFQDFALIPNLTVWENITYPLVPRGVSARQRFARAGTLLARFGLADRMLARPAELSGGERQRVAVARALVGEPEVLLADEPTSNLDPAASEAMRQLLSGFQAEGRTLIVSTHDRNVIARATTVFALEAGRLTPRPSTSVRA
jgi:putative ABC transport system ATP-binding protein